MNFNRLHHAPGTAPVRHHAPLTVLYGAPTARERAGRNLAACRASPLADANLL